MSEQLTNRIAAALANRQAEGLLRAITTHRQDPQVINLAENDYWTLAKQPEVQEAAKQAINQYGCSASASPLITGFGPAHESLLASAKAWHGFEHGLVWNSGFAANRAVLSQLPQRGDLVLADRLIHNSMAQGVLDSGARLVRYRHCDIEHLESLLAEHQSRDGVTFVVTESVFSMDGDAADLTRMAALKDKSDFVWLVDEAHAIGWYGARGSGLVEEAGVADRVDLLVGTLGKGLGSMGAYTLFHDERFPKFLVNFAPEFIYSTYLAPSAASAAECAMRLLERDTSKRQAARDMSREFRSELRACGFKVPDGDSPIVPVILGETAKVERARDRLREAGVLVGLIRPPTVPAGTTRLRISLKGGLDRAVLKRVVDVLRELEGQA